MAQESRWPLAIDLIISSSFYGGPPAFSCSRSSWSLQGGCETWIARSLPPADLGARAPRHHALLHSYSGNITLQWTPSQHPETCQWHLVFGPWLGSVSAAPQSLRPHMGAGDYGRCLISAPGGLKMNVPPRNCTILESHTLWAQRCRIQLTSHSVAGWGYHAATVCLWSCCALGNCQSSCLMCGISPYFVLIFFGLQTSIYQWSKLLLLTGATIINFGV